MNVLPRQKLSMAEKLSVDKSTNKHWGHASADYYIDQVDTSEREELLSIYRMLEGEYNEKDYNYILNPLNTTVDRYKKFGSKLRNFDIINPVLNLYEGEFGERFKNIQVLDSNPGDDNRYKEGLNSLIKNYYAQKAINDFNKLGIETGHETQEQDILQKEIDKYNLDFDSNRVVSGQEILDYIYYDKDLEEKNIEAYSDWLRAGRCFTYKGIFHNDIDYEVVRPWEITVSDNIKSNYVEDGDWVVRRQVMSPNSILDRWHDKLDDNAVNWLEQKAINNGIDLKSSFVQLSSQYIRNEADYKKYSILKDTHGIEVFHVQWKSFKKVGIVTHINELGIQAEKDVDETYILNKEAGDISVKWSWISQVWEAWRIGEEHDAIYVDVRPVPYNRAGLNNKSLQKLSYNGRIFKSVTGKVISIASAGRNYQLLYNILHYQFEKIINKNKDKIMVIPQGLIPKGVNGWDEEKFMYYANANSLAVIDETSPTAGLALNAIKVLDMSLGNFAKDSIELMNAVKNEWWDTIGMNRQRYGDIKTSDGKGISEQAIYRSAIISNELNRKFERFQEKDYAGLLDLSKLAYIEGKKGKYINSDNREAFLSVNPDDAIFHAESDYNVHVKNSKKENEKLNQAKDYGFSLGQNGEVGQMLELIDSTNFTKTKAVIKKMEAINKQREEANNQATLENNQRIEESKRESEEAEREVKRYVADKDYDKAIDVKLMEQGVSPETKEDDGANHRETVRMNNHKITVDNTKLKHDERDLQLKSKKVSADIRKSKQTNK